jgi:hypothetical protein
VRERERDVPGEELSIESRLRIYPTTNAELYHHSHK